MDEPEPAEYAGALVAAGDPAGTLAEALNDARTRPQTCYFCHDQGWDWFRYLGPEMVVLDMALPRFVVTCVVCEDLLSNEDFVGLASRVEVVDPGQSGEVLSIFRAIQPLPPTIARGA